MNFIVKLLLTGLAVIITSYLLDGVYIEDYLAAIIVAAILAILNAVVRPLLIILTIPITVFTLGIFILVINAIIILMADYLIPGFEVDGFWWALLFSIILAIINSFFESFARKN